MMFADAEHVHTDTVRQRRLFEDVSDCLCVRDERAAGLHGDVTECIQTEFE